MPSEASSKSKILIFGTGAIGSVYAFILSRVECHLTVVCRSNYEAIKANGIRIESSLFGAHVFNPDVVSSSVPEGQYDFILISAKSFPFSDQASLIASAVTLGHTTIALIQNGIDIEVPYQKLYPENPILSCVIYLPVTQTFPGVFVHKEVERLVIGTWPSNAPTSHKAKARELGALIEAGGGTSDVQEDVQSERWLKLLLNGAWNPICALTRSRDAEILSLNSGELYQPAVALIESVQKEVSLVAIAAGYPEIDEKKVEFQLGRAKARVTGMEDQGVEPSMMADVLHGRQMEIDAIVGNTVRIADRLGVGEKVPLLRMLWILGQALNHSVRR